MNKITIIGIVILVLGIIMFLFGALMYSGLLLNLTIDTIAKYSFYYWLPTIVIGVAFLTWPKKRKKVQSQLK